LIIAGGSRDILAAIAAEPPAMSAVMLQPLGGAVARIPDGGTAFRHRDAAHYLAINTMARPEDSGAERAAWAGKVLASLPAGTLLGPASARTCDRNRPEAGAHPADTLSPGSNLGAKHAAGHGRHGRPGEYSTP
jgi:hypothetical protein